MRGATAVLLGLSGAALAATVQLAASFEDGPVLDGNIADLWSGAPMTDHNLEANRSMTWLLPADLSEIRLTGFSALNGTRLNPTVKRMSTVRVLGGWGPNSLDGREPGWPDVVWRVGGPNGTGKVMYRWDALWERLDNMVEAGIAPVFVLDNVPFALAGKNATLGKYGQTKGPQNTLADYHAVVKAIVEQTASRYGAARVRETFVFRVATEPNTSPGHWSDTVEEWMAMYDAAADAVTTALPGAVVGPGNFCPFALDSGCVGTYDAVVAPIVRHIATGVNVWTGKAGATPISYLASSFYGSYGDHPGGESGYDPTRAIAEAKGIAGLRGFFPGRVLPLYFYEYGMLGSPTRGLIANEPGAFGGAWRLASSAGAVGVGVSQIFRWGGWSSLHSSNSSAVIFNSNIWLASLAYAAAVGGQRAGAEPSVAVLRAAGAGATCPLAGSVPTRAGSACIAPFVGGPAQPRNVTNADVVAGGLAVMVPPSAGTAACPVWPGGPGVRPLCPGDRLVLVTAFSPDHNSTAPPSTVEVSLPTSAGEQLSVRDVYWLDAETSPYDAVYAEAAAHPGWLQERDGAMRSFNDMLSPAGQAGIGAQLDRWRAMQEGLFSPEEGRDVTVSSAAGSVTLRVGGMSPHSVAAVVLRP